MPIARIISTSFEDALRFADYLRPLYDTVEIAQPGRANDTAVDLEVNLELCTPEQAWEQITQLSQRPEGEIFVAPGTLFPETELAEALVEEWVTEQETGSTAAGSEVDTVGHEVEAAIAQASAAAATAAGSNGSGTHKPHAGVVPEEELNWLGRARDSLRQWLAVRALLREIRQMQQEELAQEQMRQRQMALQFKRERREQEARDLAAARAAEVPAVTPEGLQPVEPLPAATFTAQEAIPQLPTSAEELQRQAAEEEEAVRRGRFVEQILRRRAADETAGMESAVPEDEAVPVEFQAVPAESFAAAEELAPVVRFSREKRSDRLRPAMALAGVTSVLLTAVLVGYAHRRPASPVPLSVLQRSNNVEQKVPFGPAVIPASEPVALPIEQATAEAPPEAAPLPERHSFRSDFRRVRVDGHEVDYVADDVTVRHFNSASRGKTGRHPATAVPISASGSRVKQISDME